MNVSRIAVSSAAALVLVAGGFGVASAKDQVSGGVTITGGTMVNTTTIGLDADGGSGIADAAGGSYNVAMTNGEGTASSGNGGSAVSDANGGVVVTGQIESGSNLGTWIEVGNTNWDGGWDGGGGDHHGGEGVMAMPETGAGFLDAGMLSVIAGAAAAAAAGVGMRRR